MVISSSSEGGANVILEAAVTGVQVLASRMDGNVDFFSADYPGYFPFGNAKALARLLRKLQNEPEFIASVNKALACRALMFRPAREIAV